METLLTKEKREKVGGYAKKKINKPQRKSRNIKMVAAATATATTTTVNYAHILERTTTAGEGDEKGGRGYIAKIVNFK